MDGRKDLWDLTVTPAGAGDVMILLAGDRPCGAGGVPCARTPDGQGRIPLSNSLAVLIPGPVSTPSLVGEFAQAPAEHDGDTAFNIRIEFSAPITANKRKFPQAFDVTGGEITRAGGVDGRKDLWELSVAPAGVDAVTIVLRGNRPCGTGGVPCAKTPDGQGRISLSHDMSQTVQGPAAISVADAEGTEGTDTHVAFTVSLDRAALKMIAVDYATSDGTATAGEDYTATSGTLSFAPGDRSNTVSVPQLDDSRSTIAEPDLLS